MNNNTEEEIDVNGIIHKLIQSNYKDIKLKQSEIRSLCIKAREIFMSQPMLLQLEAPVKIAGTFPIIQATYTGSMLTSLKYSRKAASLAMLITCFWAIMWIAEKNQSNASAFYQHIKLSFLKFSSCFAVTTNVRASIGSMGSMMNAKENII